MTAKIMVKKTRSHLHQTSAKPAHERLPWPGLKAKDHLSRVITRAVKEAKETREKEEWAENQIARVLDFVPPHTAMRLVLLEAYRRRRLTPGSMRFFSDFLRQ
jgi:hypothetical protein